jgi:peptidoglycan-associated lipoprotein
MRTRISLLVTGCKGLKKQPAPPQGGQPGGAEGSVPGVGSGSEIQVGDRPLAMGNEVRGQFEIVYFEYDSAKVKPSEVGKLSAVSAAIKGSGKKLVIEGHADERGTAEYNRALAERRALACREELVRLGVSADQISTISYGKDRPADLGHGEASWAKNRRCEFVVVGQ